MVFLVQDGLIGADADIKVAILCRLTKELHVTAMQQIIAPRDKYFFGHV